MSSRQANEISNLLAKLRIPWNQPWDGGPAIASATSSEIVLRGNMRITLLSPRPGELQRLAAHWERQLSRQKTASAAQPASQVELEESGEVPVAPPSVLVFHGRKDMLWAERIHNRTREAGSEPTWRFWHEGPRPVEVSVESLVEAAIADVRVALVLLSPTTLISQRFMNRVLPVLVTAAEKGKLALSWALLEPCLWKKTVFARFHAAHDVSRTLSELNPKERERAVGTIVRSVEALLSKRSSNQAGARDGAIEMEALAQNAFIGDSSVVNAASIAFLAEFHDKALLIGGDAHDEVLIESIRSLLARRKQKRLRVNAFVVPHGGSARHVSRALLELLECEQYLIAADGSRFRNPSRETIARIIMYGRATPDSRPKLVFNYRTPFTQVWEDPALQARYGYEAFYPIWPGPNAGITVHL